MAPTESLIEVDLVASYLMLLGAHVLGCCR